MLANMCLGKNIFPAGLSTELGTTEKGKHKEFAG